MAKGYFNIIHNNDKTDIVFEVNPSAGPNIPEDQENFVIATGNTLGTIKLIYDIRSADFKKCFDQLFNIAKVGLEGENAQLNIAIKALTQFKKEIVDKESGKIKNKYLKKLGSRALIFGLPFLIGGTFINYFVCKNTGCNCVNINYFANFMILWSGTMAGVWLSFIITRTNISFDDIASNDADGLEPIFRLLFTGLLSIIFGLLFLKKALEIKLGNLSAYDISTDPISAFLIGAILGLNEKVLGSTLTKKTAELFK